MLGQHSWMLQCLHAHARNIPKPIMLSTKQCSNTATSTFHNNMTDNPMARNYRERPALLCQVLCLTCCHLLPLPAQCTGHSLTSASAGR